MSKVKLLIDTAAKVCGGKKALADQLGFSRQYLHSVETGKTPLSVELAGRLAMVSGVSIERAIMVAAEDQLTRTEPGTKVMEALERGFLAFVAAILVIFATGSAVPGTSLATSVSQMMLDRTAIVLLRRLRRLRRLIRSGRSTMALRNHVQVRTQPLAPT